jgi:uncharacterized membrane protein
MAHIFSLILFLFFSVSSVWASTPARIVEIVQEGTEANETFQWLRLEDRSGSDIILKNYSQPESIFTSYQTGQTVMVEQFDDNWVITDFYRIPSLFWLLVLFVTVAIMVGGRAGVMSLISMFTSLGVIIYMTLPLLASGTHPILVVLLTSLIIIPIIFYLSHGFNTKIHIAVLSTLIGVVITSFLAQFFVGFSHLTGFASEDASFLDVEFAQGLDIKGLLLAGIIIGLLGVLDDVTVSQSSIVKELHLANPKLGIRELYTRAMRVGRDHASSMINTLVLVYTGASLPLLLLLNQHGLSVATLNPEIIAEEIVRTLVGSTGLVLVIPITTFMASLVWSKKQTVDKLAKDL